MTDMIERGEERTMRDWVEAIRFVLITEPGGMTVGLIVGFMFGFIICALLH